MVYKIILLILAIAMPIRNTMSEDKTLNSVLAFNYSDTLVLNDNQTKASDKLMVIRSFSGPMTAYGPDCYGCSGITASGYNVVNRTTYYDKEYGNLHILAADKTIPFGTIIRISVLKKEKTITAIVLDRGSAISFSKKSYFDLLYKSEKDTSDFGCQYVNFDILRIGF